MDSMELVYPYVKNKQVYLCPSASTINYSCYGPSSWVWHGVKLGTVVSPSRCILVVEGVKDFYGNWCADPPMIPHGSGPTCHNWPPIDWAGDANTVATVGRHNGGANLAFFDGHCKWGRVTETWVSATNNQWDPANSQ